MSIINNNMMEDVEFSLVKKKIIKMNDVIKILADKNYNLSRLIEKLKIIYFKYREKSNEAYTLRSTLEMCKLELEPLRIDYTTLLSKYVALEVEHKNFVNNSQIKYQKVCMELDNITQKHDSVCMSNLPELCKTCKSQTERNVLLSKEVKSLKMQLDNLLTMQNDKLEEARRRNTSDLNTLTENHTKELETVKIQHGMELQKIDSRYTQELDTLNSRLKYLETKESELNKKNSILKDQLNLLNAKSVCLKETNGILQCDSSTNTPHLDKYDMHWDCSGSDYEDEDVNKYISECKYLPTLLSPIDGNELSMESLKSEIETSAEMGEILAEIGTAIPCISSKDPQVTTTNKQDIKVFCIGDIAAPCPEGELEKTSEIMLSDDNDGSVSDTVILPANLNTPDIQTRLLRRKTLRAKQMRHKRLKQTLLKTLFKYVDKKLKQAKPYALTDHNHKHKNQNMSQSYKNKRKLQMIRWKYLREVCFSSTDSEHDSRMVRYRHRTQRKKNKDSGKENVIKLIRKVNENYDNLTSGFDDLSKYYHSLNLQTSDEHHNGNNTSIARMDTLDTLNTIDIDEKVQTDSPDSGYSGRSDTDYSNMLPTIEERTCKNKLSSAISASTSSSTSANDVNECYNNNSPDVSSQCTDTIAKYDFNNLNIDLEENVNILIQTTESILDRQGKCNSDHIISDIHVSDNYHEIGKKEELNNDQCLEAIKSDVNINGVDKYCKIEYNNGVNYSDKSHVEFYEENNKILMNTTHNIQDDKENHSVVDRVYYEMKKNFTESQNKLNFSTNRLKETTVEDITGQHCSKKRISHYNKLKSAGSKRQKLLEKSCIGKKEISANEQNSLHKYEEINQRANESLKIFDISEICEKMDISNIKHATKEKQCKMVQLNLNVDMCSSAYPDYSKIPTSIPSHSIAMHLKKMITFPDETTIFAEVVSVLSAQDSDSIIRYVLQEVSFDTNSKPDKNFTPPAPVLTEAQRALLALLTKLQKMSFPHLLDEFMLASEQLILQECNLQNIQPVTRLYLAVCKLTRNLDRMRRMVCDTLYFLGDLSVPFLFTVLSTWIEVLPLEQDCLDNPLVKVIIQVINLKTCNIPGYNLLPLKNLLQGYFGYPTERWNSNDVFKDIFTQFSVTPSMLLEYCLLILCKNHPWKWTRAQIDVYVKPTLESNCMSITSRDATASLLRNIIAGVDDDIADFNIKDK